MYPKIVHMGLGIIAVANNEKEYKRLIRDKHLSTFCGIIAVIVYMSVIYFFKP